MRQITITIFTILISLLSANTIFAQLSTRENSPTVLNTGTRPTWGTYGFFIGPSFAEIAEMVDEDIEIRGVPLMNFKYYSTEKTEFRIGLQLYKKSEKIDGDLSVEETEGLTKHKTVESVFRLTPAIIQHFSPKNILDPYVGFGLSIGNESDKETMNYDYGSGDYSESSIKKNSIVWGASAFFGIQTFIADLPLSIGLEFGISGLKHSKLQYKHEGEYTIDGIGDSYEYYTTDLNGNGTQYKNLKNSKYEIGSDLRMTITYYFTK